MIATDSSSRDREEKRTHSASSSRVRLELFLISFLILFLELACIRWFPAHVLYLTFFTNSVLLACFLGMSSGCLAAKKRRNFLLYTPVLLALAMIAALALSDFRFRLEHILSVGNQASPQVVFFGIDYRDVNPTKFFVPIETVEGVFFLVIALAFVGPGQVLGQTLDRVPSRIEAYTLNIVGSLAGVLSFALFSRFELSPFWWFLVVVTGLSYFLCVIKSLRSPWAGRVAVMVLGVVLACSAATSSFFSFSKDHRHLWSPYYRVDYYYPPLYNIVVNLIGHQIMISRDRNISQATELPYLLQRDSGGAPFRDVLIIGAGSGNDVSRALQWNVRHVDAVEIDPAIQRLGQNEHPDQPYSDPRVSVHINDGRNFLRSTDSQYDVIIYALVDSLVLHSGYANIRLESFLFTREAFSDVRRHLKPNGMFIMYNYFRDGWIIARLEKELREEFGANPLVFMLPYRGIVQPETHGGFTVLASGAKRQWEEAFRTHPEYWVSAQKPASPSSPNGFLQHPEATEQSQWIRVGPASVSEPEGLRSATDDWPQLYIRNPMVPGLSLRGMLVMGGLSLLVLLCFLPRMDGGRGLRRFRGFNGTMFLLGAGFMLVETDAVVHMALLFGSTWIVNTVVFAAVLLMILVANLFVLKIEPQQLKWPYVGLLASLAVNVLLPLDSFLGMTRSVQVVAACFLVFAPILFAGVIFAVIFGRSASPDSDFGSNIAGAILGGLAEYLSTLLGFQYVMMLSIVFYSLSVIFLKRSGYHSTPPARVSSRGVEEPTHIVSLLPD